MCLRMSPTTCHTTQLHTPEVGTINITKFLHVSEYFSVLAKQPNHGIRTVPSTRSVAHRARARVTCARCIDMQRAQASHTAPTSSSVSAEHFLALSITSSRLCLPRVGKTLGKAFEKPRNSRWLHFATTVGVTVELSPKLNITCIVFEDEFCPTNRLSQP